MNIRIKGMFENTMFTIVARDTLINYLKFSFWVSPLALWKIYELVKPYLGV